MDLGEPDNPMAIAELVDHLTETSTTTLRCVDTLRINLRLQQHDVLHEEQHATLLRQEYLPPARSCHGKYSRLQAQQDLRRVQQQSEEHHHSRWLALERTAHLEYSRARAAQLDEVGRFEQGLIN
eukprot:3717013-Amphidinium_carterae.1